ncbi:Peptidase M20 domain-containing protein 2 [Pleurostoma richardsiae]|uniref:Peptidase M20 domain-containing protein 2 n=1 Tax=Pleurostoma richardsiae TaxID=41990 RepID=A0AA38VNY4_9PEZI|nr:Peptidase M20 domain-containing protein 2 [Pleurostoma richardsiae]
MATPAAPAVRDSTVVINKAIDDRAPKIRVVSDTIHANPELAYKEFKAHDAIVSLLESLGLDVTPHAYGLETAFSAEYGSGGRLVIFNAEYDALPGIGHACGHNLIASASLAAFLGLVEALKKSAASGRVRLLGTPAEEGGGGKLKLLEAGAYEGASACLMIHPAPAYLFPGNFRGVAFCNMLANVKKRIYLTGREAHAAMEPWNGLNALDALCLGYNAVSMLRQQIHPHERMHGVFRQAGDSPNVIPGHCAVDYYMRSDTRVNAEKLWGRVQKCFEGAALSTGCEARAETINCYADVRPSVALCKAYVAAMPDGTVSYDGPPSSLPGSTDMGDVCYACPGFHGGFGIDAEPGQGNHTKGFTKAAGLDDSFARAIECGKGMAAVGWKVLTDDQFAANMKQEWEEDMERAKEGKPVLSK